MPPLTLRSVLDLPVVQSGEPEVVAGHTGLDAEVRWVHAAETLRIPELMRGGEILLTTGMGFGSRGADQRSFVDRLADRSVVALIVELGTVWTTLPAPLCAAADRRGLPLVALHREVRFVDITEAVHREIVDHQAVLGARVDEALARLTELMLDGAELPEVLGALAGIISNPVCLEQDSRGLAYHAADHASDAAVLAAWQAVAHDRPPVPFHASVPITVGERVSWGRLVAIALESPLDELAGLLLARSASLIALALLRSRQEDDLLMRERGGFLLDALINRTVDELEATNRAHDLGFDANGQLLLPVLIAPARPGLVSHDSRWSQVWSEIQNELHARRHRLLAGTRAGSPDLAMVVSLRSGQQRAELADRLAGIARAASDRWVGSPTAAVLCVGPPARTWTELRDGLRETAAAAPVLCQTPYRPWHDVTVADLERLLAHLSPQESVQQFVARRLGPLLENKGGRNSTLLSTLEAFCSSGWRKAETARALHLKRQSLYHRLSRIEQLLDTGLDDPDTQLGLHLALRLRRFGAGRNDLNADIATDRLFRPAAG